MDRKAVRLRRMRKIQSSIDSLTSDEQRDGPKRPRRSSSPVDLDSYECELFHKSCMESSSNTLMKSGTRRKQALIPTMNCCALKPVADCKDPSAVVSGPLASSMLVPHSVSLVILTFYSLLSTVI